MVSKIFKSIIILHAVNMQLPTLMSGSLVVVSIKDMVGALVAVCEYFPVVGASDLLSGCLGIICGGCLNGYGLKVLIGCMG